MGIHHFKAIDITGKERELSEFKDKVILIVNTASKCGFTPQYAGLQELYKKYEGKLEVLAFPCNQFGKQEPGESNEIAEFCDLKFNVSFPIFDKIDVNGENTHPLYDYLKKERPGLLGSQNIKWNFTKFLIDKNGEPVKRYAPQVKPNELEKDIEELL
ncbi:glutathione peroxidase [Bacteriovorax sp. DB6_IX]|uniref:glutathione peroxidase n=1 Tax=Bacteriovorax sp. DB6_IX TaxID=1353530 RepID=UPI00038A55D0|nr:glutathione peroxidase [Bacteriovorax sp. DB6_IX]EQC52704.1 glutathione peroxidase [Bacteriovorax sp. DB6_IX]